MKNGIDVMGVPGTIGEIFDAFIELAVKQSTISKSKRSVDGDMINRHLVLHGKDCAYGTEVNSLRCIVQLEFLTDVADTIRDRRERDADFQRQEKELYQFLQEQGIPIEGSARSGT